jgi:N-acetylneuraminate synthase
MATEPKEMQAMVRACHNVYNAIGGTGRLLGEVEKGQIPKMRRSIVTKNDVSSGDVLTAADIEFKRPGTGISPANFRNVIGRTLNKAITGGTIIQTSDLELTLTRKD